MDPLQLRYVPCTFVPNQPIGSMSQPGYSAVQGTYITWHPSGDTCDLTDNLQLTSRRSQSEAVVSLAPMSQTGVDGPCAVKGLIRAYSGFSFMRPIGSVNRKERLSIIISVVQSSSEVWLVETAGNGGQQRLCLPSVHNACFHHRHAIHLFRVCGQY